VANDDRNLDDEGVPDLEAPLPEKEATGDPQEGVAPPNDAPRASVDRGITAEEQQRPEPIDERVAREEPDIGEAPGAQPRDAVQASEPQGTLPDDEADLVADESPAEGAPDPEDRAMRTERD
jgi:hypothetical protein